MKDITECILAEMRAARVKLSYLDQDGKLFQVEGDHLCAWDINCGWCENWATAASDKYGGEPEWLDQIDPLFSSLNHCILIKDGRYYDSQHPDGVDDLNQLDLVRGVSRKEFLLKS
jgi:hypothetical protein